MKDDIRHVYPLLIIFFAVFLLHPGGLAQALPRREQRSPFGCRHGPGLVNLLLESHDARSAA